MATYPMVCHVCGREWEMEADFLSLPASREDGRQIGTCNMDPALPRHSGREIRESWFSHHSGGKEVR